jgi:hypothetical protein
MDHKVTFEEFWPRALETCKSAGSIIGGDSQNASLKSTKGPTKIEIGEFKSEKSVKFSPTHSETNNLHQAHTQNL